MNLGAVSISSLKSKEPSKLLIGDLIPPPLYHSMKLPCVSSLLNIQGGKELCNNLIVPIFVEDHCIPQVLSPASSHHIIKYEIMLTLHIVPVNPLRDSYKLALRNDDRLIEVLLKSCVKHVVNTNFLLNKPRIFLPLSPH
jgi:hypothetical protein